VQGKITPQDEEDRLLIGVACENEEDPPPPEGSWAGDEWLRIEDIEIEIEEGESYSETPLYVDITISNSTLDGNCCCIRALMPNEKWEGSYDGTFTLKQSYNVTQEDIDEINNQLASYWPDAKDHVVFVLEDDPEEERTQFKLEGTSGMDPALARCRWVTFIPNLGYSESGWDGQDSCDEKVEERVIIGTELILCRNDDNVSLNLRNRYAQRTKNGGSWGDWNWNYNHILLRKLFMPVEGCLYEFSSDLDIIPTTGCIEGCGDPNFDPKVSGGTP